MKKEQIKLNKIVNLTPHDITIVSGEGKNTILKSMGIVRVNESSEVIGEIEGIKVIKKTLSNVQKEAVEKIRNILKDPEAAVIVSSLTARALKEELSKEELKRTLIIGNTVRDASGRVIGANALARACDL